MTTHYQKIQALGNKMAANLTSMGVESTFSEGGLTLADKILAINYFKNGTFLTASKTIGQKNDTINLIAMYLQDGVAQPGKTIKYYTAEDTILSSRTLNGSHEYLRDNYFMDISTMTAERMYIGNGANGNYIQFTSSKIHFYGYKEGDEYSYDGGVIHIKNGILTYTNNGVSHDVDISEYQSTRYFSGGEGVTLGECTALATTNSDGYATYTYTFGGKGLLHFIAELVES